MRNLFSIFILIILICSCKKDLKSNQGKKTQEIVLSSSTKEPKENFTSKKLDKKEAENFVKEFYNWYLSEIYPTKATYYENPPYIRKDGYFILSEDILVKRLKSVKYFSDIYIDDKIERLKKCNKSLFKEKITIEPEGGISIKDCNYLDRYDFVVGNGERFNGFDITNSDMVNGGVLVTLNLKIEDDYVAFSKVLVNKFEGNQFEIVKVEVDWL